MLAVSAFPARRVQGPEPLVALGGAAVLGAAWTLPLLWSRGISPIPPCIFHTVTGPPCPFCGGTRSFVALAHGDVAAAVHVFPVGPLLFAGLILAVLYSTGAVLSGRRVRVTMGRDLRRVLTVLAVLVLLVNWGSKLLFLGY
ncbi:MAG: hypothetical protein NVSMB17_08270 [Candidatus Dormibacteria bacterium]